MWHRRKPRDISADSIIIHMNIEHPRTPRTRSLRRILILTLFYSSGLSSMVRIYQLHHSNHPTDEVDIVQW